MSGHAGGLPVLTYHAIGTDRSPTCTDRAWFAETLAALDQAGFRGIDLHDWVAQGRPDEPGGFSIAFDDGLRSVMEVVDALRAFGVPATVFLVTDRVGERNDWPGQPQYVPREALLSWGEIAELAAAGIRFGAHGRTHARLDRCDPPRIDQELRDSRDTIEDRLGLPCRLVAFPYGLTSPAVREAAETLFDAGFGTRLDYASRVQDAFNLSRIDAHYLRSRAALDALIAGRLGGRLAIRRVLRAMRYGTLGSGPSYARLGQGDAAA